MIFNQEDSLHLAVDEQASNAGSHTAAPRNVIYRRSNVGTFPWEHFLAVNVGILKPLLTFAWTILMGFAASSAVRIGPEALLPLPSSALYHCEIGNQPDDGSVQSL